MNLFDCLALTLAASEAASDSDNSTRSSGGDDGFGDFSECMSDWLWKSHTNFHGNASVTPERLGPLFGVLCWSYCLAGITMFLTKPKWTKESRFPFVTMALILIFLQGPLSYTADYLNMAEDSIYHTIDRCLACPMMALEVGKVFTMYPHVRGGTFCAYASATCLAVISFIKSSESQVNHDASGFIFWHNMWHMYPLFGCIIMAYDFFVLGEYDAMAASSGPSVRPKEKIEADCPKRKLLSSVIMEKSMSVPSSPLRCSARLRARVSRQ